MKFNSFNEPVPHGAMEISEALEHQGLSGSDCRAMIDFNTDDGDFNGFTAEVRSEEEDIGFSTKGYESKEQLIADLRSNFIYDIGSYS